MTFSLPRAICLLVGSGLCLLLALCLYLATAFSTGPLEPILGKWARVTHFQQYRGGSSGYETNAQPWIVVLALLGLLFLVVGGLDYSGYKYWSEHPDGPDPS